MNTYIVISYTNHGEVIHVINAEDILQARRYASEDPNIWYDDCDIAEVDTSSPGVVFGNGVSI